MTLLKDADIKFLRNCGDALPVYTTSRLCSCHPQALQSTHKHIFTLPRFPIL